MICYNFLNFSRCSREDEDLGRWSYTNATGPLMNNELTSRLSSLGESDSCSAQPNVKGVATSAPLGYSHNTYHGQRSVHHRTPLVMDPPKPLRFTDNSGQLLSSSLAGSQRRRISNSGIHSGVCQSVICNCVSLFIVYIPFFFLRHIHLVD